MPEKPKAVFAAKSFFVQVRRAVADYIASEGCSCCQGSDHGEHKKRLAKLLKVPAYSDGSGYDFSKFKSGEETP